MSEPRLVFDEKYRVGEWVAEHMPDGASWHDYYGMGAEANGDLVSVIVFEISALVENARFIVAASNSLNILSSASDEPSVLSNSILPVRHAEKEIADESSWPI